MQLILRCLVIIANFTVLAMHVPASLVGASKNFRNEMTAGLLQEC